MPAAHADVPGDVDSLVGKRVQELMRARHLTQTAVAAPLGIEQSALSRKLKGQRGWSLRELIIVAQILGTSPHYLLGETDDLSPAAGCRRHKRAGDSSTFRSRLAKLRTQWPRRT